MLGYRASIATRACSLGLRRAWTPSHRPGWASALPWCAARADMSTNPLRSDSSPDRPAYEAAFSRSMEDPVGFWDEVGWRVVAGAHTLCPDDWCITAGPRDKPSTPALCTGIACTTRFCPPVAVTLDQPVTLGLSVRVWILPLRAPSLARCTVCSCPLTHGAECGACHTGGETNTCRNCLDVHVAAGRGDQPALIFDSAITGEVTTFTYSELLGEVDRFAGALRNMGVGKGDTVVIYLPMVAEAAIAMLACARLGAIHSVVRLVMTSRRRSGAKWVRHSRHSFAAARRCLVGLHQMSSLYASRMPNQR